MSRRSKDCQIEKRCLNHELALNASLLGGGRTPREAIHCTTIIARRALSPSTPRAYGATLRASGVDRSARPSKEGPSCHECRQPKARRLRKGNRPMGKTPPKTLLTCGASYKPPALPGDI